MSEKALFRVGGVYRQTDGQIVRLTALSFKQWDRQVATGELLTGEYKGRGSGARFLDDGRYVYARSTDDTSSDLIPGELHEVNGQWVPLEQSLKFPSGATLHTDGSKIVGRTEAQASVYAKPFTGTLHPALAGFARSPDLPMPAKLVGLHGSAHLLPKG